MRNPGSSTKELVELYYHRRLLARVFHEESAGWVLKGGQALLLRWSTARYSTDVDLLRAARGESVEDAVAALIVAAGLDLGDSLRFEHARTSGRMDMDRPTRNVTFDAMFGLRKLHTVSVDVVSQLGPPHGRVIEEQLTPPFPDDTRAWPRVRMWPLEDHTADKIVAMYERHGGERMLPSSRFKDLVDLVLIALRAALCGRQAHRALHAETRRRRAAGTTVLLPARFEIPDPSWFAGYQRQAQQIADLPADLGTLDGALPLADAFVTPLLRAEPPAGDWNPDRRSWEP